MKFRRQNRDAAKITGNPKIPGGPTDTTPPLRPRWWVKDSADPRPPSDQSATIAPPSPLVAIRGRLSIRLQYLDDSIARFDQDKLSMQQEMESLKKQIFEIDRATLAQPIMEKLRELYK